MRAVIQRVKFASVRVGEEVIAEIQTGLLIFVGFEDADSNEDAEWLSTKICQLRMFNDDRGVMNRSV